MKCISNGLASFFSILDTHAPLKQKRVRGDQLPWVTPELLKQIRYRNKLYKKYRKHNSEEYFENFRVQRNKVRALKRQLMRQYFDDSTTNAKPSDFWKKLKPLLPSKKNPTQNIILVDSTRSVTDQIDVANVFKKSSNPEKQFF